MLNKQQKHFLFKKVFQELQKHLRQVQKMIFLSDICSASVCHQVSQMVSFCILVNVLNATVLLCIGFVSKRGSRDQAVVNVLLYPCKFSWRLFPHSVFP